MSLVRPLAPVLQTPLPGVLGTGLPWESGGGGAAVSAPANTVAPVISSDGSVIGIGETLTSTSGTWTGTPTPTYTYQWQRAATFGGGGSYANIGGATAATHVVVAADVGYSLRCVVTATNAAGSSSANSNALLYLHATDLPNSAVAINRTADMTTADSGTTVDQWRAAFGGKAANIVLDALAATNRPAYSATGGPNGAALVTFDGVDNVIRDAAITAYGITPAAVRMDVVGYLGGAEAANDVIMRWRPASAGTDQVTLNTNATPVARGTTAGTGGATSTGTTTITTTHRMMTYSAFSGVSGSQRIAINGSDEDTDAITHAAWTDDGDLAVGASITGAAPVNLLCIGWAFTFGASAAEALSVSQRANLRAFFQNGTGVA